MLRLAPYTHLILEALQEIHRRHATAGWYDVRYLIKWLESKRKPELKALYDAYDDAPNPRGAVQAAIEAYLPALNQKKMGTIPIDPKGSVIMWKVSPKTSPPLEAPAPRRRRRARSDRGGLGGSRGSP